MSAAGKKKTPDGNIVLEPQPDDSDNDPLNWPAWKRDAALLSLGFYCMVGGGMTPILAAGFTNVAEEYDVTLHEVALTAGLFMMGMGVGSVVASPTAILYGKRPVYLVSCVIFIGTSIWCAAAPNYTQLVVARVLQGIAVSPVECLPSATIAEIFFLHERAFRIGIYTLLLLGGKNLVPLVSAVIINSLSWRWVFWIVTFIVAGCWFLLFFFLPETFWDRTPRPKSRGGSRLPSVSNIYRRMSSLSRPGSSKKAEGGTDGTDEKTDGTNTGTATPMTPDISFSAPAPHNTPAEIPQTPSSLRPPGLGKKSPLHVGFTVDGDMRDVDLSNTGGPTSRVSTDESVIPRAKHSESWRVEPTGYAPPTPDLHNFNSPFYTAPERTSSDYIERGRARFKATPGRMDGSESEKPMEEVDREKQEEHSPAPTPGIPRYTTILRKAPKRTYVQQLRPFEGRLSQDNWFRVALRPFILFTYPAVLWSSIVYACSIGWLIVISESMALIYRDKESYNFSALSTGLVYLSPFIGGVLGTAVAGKLSDIVVMAMAKRNGGLYEPEFRLVMIIPVAITTGIGLMGFGWSAEEKEIWIVPTIFFGTISFGCSLGSTTAITFCVDSYRQYAGEALVTLNFSKNIFHGLVFSLFVVDWLEHAGPKTVYLALGGIQLAALLLTVPMYVFGKRARMWTVRKNLMEKF